MQTLSTLDPPATDNPVTPDEVALWHLRKHHTLTRREALVRYNIKSLSDVIRRLRTLGWVVAEIPPVGMREVFSETAYLLAPDDVVEEMRTTLQVKRVLESRKKIRRRGDPR
jgi:hypothetical protein